MRNEEDYYDDGEAPNKPTTDAEPEKMEGEDDGSPTAILPKSILMGKPFEVGDEVVLKITGIHEDDIQVEYAPAKKSDKSESGDSEMASMYE